MLSTTIKAKITKRSRHLFHHRVRRVRAERGVSPERPHKPPHKTPPQKGELASGVATQSARVPEARRAGGRRARRHPRCGKSANHFKLEDNHCRVRLDSAHHTACTTTTCRVGSGYKAKDRRGTQKARRDSRERGPYLRPVQTSTRATTLALSRRPGGMPALVVLERSLSATLPKQLMPRRFGSTGTRQPRLSRGHHGPPGLDRDKMFVNWATKSSKL